MSAPVSRNCAWSVPSLHPLLCGSAEHLADPIQITAWIDEGLDSRSYIVPGLGDFGDRYVWRCPDRLSHSQLTHRFRYFL